MQVGTKQDRRRNRAAVAASVAAHVGVVALLLAAQAGRPAYVPDPEPPPMPVTLVQSPPPPEPAPAAKPAGAAKAAAPAPAPPPRPVRLARAAPAEVALLMVRPAPAPAPPMTLSDGELVGARTAGSGAGAGGGGTGGEGGQPCDMVQRLQAALRRDREVQAAASQAHRAAAGRGALLVWNGDWVLSPGQDGKGLAGIRQAIALEVAFAPEACRAEPMRGLVLLTLADGPGAPRLALGSGQWRWRDLLLSRGAAAPRRG